MSYSDSSQLLNKQAELKALQTKYNEYVALYTPVTTISSTIPNVNAISTTNPPPNIRPGEDFGEYWKHVSSGANDASGCWNSAAKDPRIFKEVVYTGNTTATNGGDVNWNNQCYGLIWNAPSEVSYTTRAPGYSKMTSNTGFDNSFYTKGGITDADQLNKATQMADMKSRIDTLIEEISIIATSSINSEMETLALTSGSQMSMIDKINNFMTSSANMIQSENEKIEQRKNMNHVFEDINKQISLKARKFRFIFYVIIGIVLIIAYLSYTSKLTLIEQYVELSNYVSWGWWTNWKIVAFVVVLLILSSFGWDMKGNIMMIIRYITDPEFWTGQMWWVGVTFLLLIVIFLHATFKSFFAPAMASLEKIAEEDE